VRGQGYNPLLASWRHTVAYHARELGVYNAGKVKADYTRKFVSHNAGKLMVYHTRKLMVYHARELGKNFFRNAICFLL